MKTNTINNRKAAILIAASFIISALPFASTFAGEKTTSTVSVAEAMPVINTRYLGEKDNEVYICIALNQPTDESSNLRIYDYSGLLLYEETVNTKNQARVIKVSPDELSSLQIEYKTVNNKSVKKLVVINTIEYRKYDIAEVAKF